MGDWRREEDGDACAKVGALLRSLLSAAEARSVGDACATMGGVRSLLLVVWMVGMRALEEGDWNRFVDAANISPRLVCLLGPGLLVSAFGGDGVKVVVGMDTEGRVECGEFEGWIG